MEGDATIPSNTRSKLFPKCLSSITVEQRHFQAHQASKKLAFHGRFHRKLQQDVLYQNKEVKHKKKKGKQGSEKTGNPTQQRDKGSLKDYGSKTGPSTRQTRLDQKDGTL